MEAKAVKAPRKSADRKRAGSSEKPRPTLAFRVNAGLYEQVRASAEQRELSITEEIERRLGQSFHDADQSEGLKVACRLVKRTWQFLEERISDQWADREPGKAAMRQAMLDVIDFGFPAKSREEMTEADRVELDQLVDGPVEKVVDMITWKNTNPEAYPEDHLMRLATPPLSSTETHALWRKARDEKATD